MTTIADLFRSRGLMTWWTADVTQGFGGRSNGEWGNDYAVPANTPVGSISDGRVVFVGTDPNHPGSSIGRIVQVQAPDGSLYHYQHLRAASVQVGDAVSAGDTLGMSGGCPDGGYGQFGGCSYTDAWSTGPHIEVRYSPTYNAAAGFWYQNWQDPTAAFAGQAGTSVDANARTSILNGSGALANTTTESAASTQPVTGTGPGVDCVHKLSVFPGAAFCMDPFVDGSVRAALLLGGAALIVFGIITFLAGHADARAAVGKAGGQLGKIRAGLATAATEAV